MNAEASEGNLASLGDVAPRNASDYLDKLPAASIEHLSTKDEFLQTSAASVFAQAVLLLIGAKLSTNTDEGGPIIPGQCPSVTEEGAKVTVTGGCTDLEGVRWKGRFTVWDLQKLLDSNTPGQPSDNKAPPMLATAEYVNFGSIEQRTCGEKVVDDGAFFNGRVELEQLGGDETTFSIELVVKQIGVDAECQHAYSYAIAYKGSMVKAHETEPQLQGQATKELNPLTRNATWNGAGRIGWEHIGSVDAETNDERLVESCATEPISGSTTIRSGNDVALITYDGITKCDDPGEATWSLNGEYQGTLTGVTCATAPGSGALGASILLLMALVAMRLGTLKRS